MPRRRAADADRRPPDEPAGRRSFRASDFIHDLADLAGAGTVTAVVLWCRVSARVQARTGNASDQEANLRRALQRLGIPVVAAFLHVGPGWDLHGGRLAQAVQRAREHGAILVAETTDRFLRHPGYHSRENPDARPTEAQFRELARLAGGVVLATHLDPDASPAEVRRYQALRGQQAKGSRGGRPKLHEAGYKKRRRERLRPAVLRLWQSGRSVREIARRVRVPQTTVHNWISEGRTGVPFLSPARLPRRQPQPCDPGKSAVPGAQASRA